MRRTQTAAHLGLGDSGNRAGRSLTFAPPDAPGQTQAPRDNRDRDRDDISHASGESRLSLFQSRNASRAQQLQRARQQQQAAQQQGGSSAAESLKSGATAMTSMTASRHGLDRQGRESPQFNCPALRLNVDELLCVTSKAVDPRASNSNSNSSNNKGVGSIEVGSYITSVEDLRCRDLLHLNVMLSALAGKTAQIVLDGRTEDPVLVDIPLTGGYQVTKSDLWHFALWGHKPTAVEGGGTQMEATQYKTVETMTAAPLYSTFDTARQIETNAALDTQLHLAREEIQQLKERLKAQGTTLKEKEDDLASFKAELAATRAELDDTATRCMHKEDQVGKLQTASQTQQKKYDHVLSSLQQLERARETAKEFACQVPEVTAVRVREGGRGVRAKAKNVLATTSAGMDGGRSPLALSFAAPGPASRGSSSNNLLLPGSPRAGDGLEWSIPKSDHLLNAAAANVSDTSPTASHASSLPPPVEELTIPPPPPDFEAGLVKIVPPAQSKGTSVGTETSMRLLQGRGNKYELREVHRGGVRIAKVPFALWGDEDDTDDDEDGVESTFGGYDTLRPTESTNSGGSRSPKPRFYDSPSSKGSLLKKQKSFHQSPQGNNSIGQPGLQRAASMLRRGTSFNFKGGAGVGKGRISDEELRLRTHVERLFVQLASVSSGGAKAASATSPGPRTTSPPRPTARFSDPLERNDSKLATPLRAAAATTVRHTSISPPGRGPYRQFVSPAEQDRILNPTKASGTTPLRSGGAKGAGGRPTSPPERILSPLRALSVTPQAQAAKPNTASSTLHAAGSQSRVAHIVRLLRCCGQNSDIAVLTPMLSGDELLAVWRLQFVGTVEDFVKRYVKGLAPDVKQQQKSNNNSSAASLAASRGCHHFELWTRGRIVSGKVVAQCEEGVRHWLMDGAPFTCSALLE